MVTLAIPTWISNKIAKVIFATNVDVKCKLATNSASTLGSYYCDNSLTLTYLLTLLNKIIIIIYFPLLRIFMGSKQYNSFI